MKTVYFLWILPFSLFIFGYFFMAYMVLAPTLETPDCTGKHIQEALKALTEYDLNAKLLEEKEDDDLIPGTIIAQHPTYKQKVKPHQTIFLVVSKLSKKISAPSLVGLPLSELTQKLKNDTISHKNYLVPSVHPHATCIAQLPRPGEVMHTKKIITYSSAPTEKLVIFPDLTHSCVREVIEFLEKYSIKPYISHTKEPPKQHICTTCTIIDQKPLAGSIVTLDESHDVHLHINHVA